MTNLAKGALLGAANVLVVAFMIAAIESRHSSGWSAEAFSIVMIIGIVPGTLVGALIAAVAGRLETWRLVVMASLAVLAVVMLGAFTEPELIGPASIPTIVLTAVLERWTRTGQRSELSGLGKGALLGIANVCAIACLAGIAIALDLPRSHGGELGAGDLPGRNPALQLAQLIVIVGLVPGTVAGALLGWMATSVQCARALRLTMVAGPAMLVVAWLGAVMGRLELVVSACIPTLVAAVILERWTRRSLPIPLAVVRA
jgi:hypothetical protein